MRYYTAKGDSGTTKLFSCPQGVRLSKSDSVFEVLGGVDELNCFVGWCRAIAERSSFQGSDRVAVLAALCMVQEDLFIIQAELGGSAVRLLPEKIEQLDVVIGRFANMFPEVRSFVIPGATELGALLDVTRAVARRVERLSVKERKGSGREGSTRIAYLNRTSSLLYALARYANYAHGEVEQAPSYR